MNSVLGTLSLKNQQDILVETWWWQHPASSPGPKSGRKAQGYSHVFGNQVGDVKSRSVSMRTRKSLTQSGISTNVFNEVDRV